MKEVMMTIYNSPGSTSITGPVTRACAQEAPTIEGLTLSIAHEITQPLHSLKISITSCLRELRQPTANISQALFAAERAERDSNRLKAIVEAMRQQVMQIEPVDLRESINDARLLLEHDIVSTLATVRINVCKDLPLVWANRLAVVQILVNLMNNGLQAMAVIDDDFRELRISAKTMMNDEVALTVWDSGDGIAEGHLPKLFNPFFTTKVGGTGIGLPICRSLIESMGGTIAASNHEAGGAMFECHFRVAQPYTKSP
jgi:C4-dicarboxylate-specific signal transduction histidine kinase